MEKIRKKIAKIITKTFKKPFNVIVRYSVDYHDQ